MYLYTSGSDSRGTMGDHEEVSEKPRGKGTEKQEEQRGRKRKQPKTIKKKKQVLCDDLSFASLTHDPPLPPPTTQLPPRLLNYRTQNIVLKSF